MDINQIVTVVTLLGGFEAVKWVIKEFQNRKTNKRRENAGVLALEIENYHRIIDAYEKRLNERDKKVDSIYSELRQEQEKMLELMERYNTLRLDHTESSIRKCNVRACKDRQPPSDF